MNKTPRTDAAEYLQTDTDPPERLGMVDVEFARGLERESAELQALILRLAEDYAGFRQAVGHTIQSAAINHALTELDRIAGTNHFDTFNS